jgi:hypothetical protein
VYFFYPLLRLKPQLPHLQFTLNLHLGQQYFLLLVSTVLEETQQFGQAPGEEGD